LLIFKVLEGYIDVPLEVPEILAPLVMKLCREYVDTSQSSGTPRYIHGIFVPDDKAVSIQKMLS
jgi:hypothetical protein